MGTRRHCDKLTLSILVGATLTACGDGQIATAERIATPEPAGPATEEAPARIRVLELAPYGEYLAGEQGRALYMFTADQQGQRSACDDRCAQLWPRCARAQCGQGAGAGRAAGQTG